MTADERRAYMVGFRMAIESSRTRDSRLIDSLAIVVGDTLEGVEVIMEKAHKRSNEYIKKEIENRPIGLR